MYRYYIIAAIALSLNIADASAAGKRDSIGVENYNGKKLIVHQVVAKDTYYSIARRYKVNPKDVLNFNDSKFLQVGVLIKVPTDLPFESTAPTATGAPGSEVAGDQTSGTIEHVVQRKENLNMLAERYGTTVNEIKRINNLRSINLQIGQILKMPAGSTAPEPPVSSSASSPSVTPSNPSEELIVHTVASNETIYSIATRYKLSIDQLKAKNNLTSSSLRVGQRLLIKGEYPAVPVPEPATASDTLNSITDPKLRYPASRYGLNQIDEKGTGVWIADADLDPTKMLVLHRNAPIGGIIKITNPMTNRSTFAKVVGKFTENESTKDVIIVMTKAVADALGALDKRFYCNLTYGASEVTHEEEQ
ncbi:LysM peptidoglycan-binding domain-containing protein [Pedobacter faecalis]|uniref:LysM peptidoglycan-binding domain-containing protein n=1 Tax=Pedobacter faecalis TaxID=3041495 RepID=UPI00254FBF6C|nr:LysM peptidoglycan-binding domain-containing protein [Pedobacter sp. ELA7]